MHGPDQTRRRLLVAVIGGAGILSTGFGTAAFRACIAWAQGVSGAPVFFGALARRLYPHAAIDDAVYGEVIDTILAAALHDDSLSDALNAAHKALGSDWYEAAPVAQIRSLAAAADTVWFGSIQAAVRGAFYNHPAVWKHISYPGASVGFGGYVDRGFDDIDWLPEDP